MSSGTLYVRPKQAKLKHDTDTFTKMDPYCRVTLGNASSETKVHDGGGKYPVWKDTLTFKRVGEDYINIEVWDKDVTSDDQVGDCTLPLQEICDAGKVAKWYTLAYNGKNAGEIMIEFEFKIDANVQKNNQFLNYNTYGNTTSMMMSTGQFNPMFGNVQGTLNNQNMIYTQNQNQYYQQQQQQNIYNPYQQQQQQVYNPYQQQKQG